MENTESLEAHIVLEMEKWSSGRHFDEEWDYAKYDNPYIEFGQRAKISCGQVERLEIHKGNTTEVYFEERRFRPNKLLILAIPNLKKDQFSRVDYHTSVFYQHPDGTWYSRCEITAYDGKRSKIPVQVPFEYDVRSLLSIPKANKLLKRNPEVLKEITDRIEALEAMKDTISEHGITSDSTE